MPKRKYTVSVTTPSGKRVPLRSSETRKVFYLTKKQAKKAVKVGLKTKGRIAKNPRIKKLWWA